MCLPKLSATKQYVTQGQLFEQNKVGFRIFLRLDSLPNYYADVCVSACMRAYFCLCVCICPSIKAKLKFLECYFFCLYSDLTTDLNFNYATLTFNVIWGLWTK